MAQTQEASEQVFAAVELACRERGLRLTPLRRQVLALILQAGGPVKAYELLDNLKTDHHGAAPPTVYRALDFLLENHFIHRLETMNAYVSCFHPEAQHSGQFLICEQCDQVTEVSTPGMSQGVLKAAHQRGFHPNKQVVEVYGTCKECCGTDHLSHN